MNLRASAIVMKSLPATAWGDALLISREEARRIGYELEQAAERIEALEARATPALPDGMAIVPAEGFKIEAGSEAYQEIIVTAPGGGQQIFWPEDAAHGLMKAMLAAREQSK